MEVVLLMVAVFAGYILTYRLYGRYLSKKIFKLDNSNPVPSSSMEDGIDYVPTKKEVLFGHHFTSIAGTGPIVGPAIAIIWGWVPAVIWVFFGSIFIGAVHDFGVLVISMRNKGVSIAKFTEKYISPRTKVFFFIIGFLELWLFISILGMIIAIIFDMFPGSVFPVWFEIPLAILLGFMVQKKGKNMLFWSIIAVIVMYITVIIGTYIPFTMPEIFGIPATGVWTIILLIYAYIASVLPITTLLQPRDFINSHQLIIAMTLLIIGIFAAAFSSDLEIVAPAVNLSPSGAPAIWPFIFITIACGAVSGFHAIVSSGTSSKQISKEKDALMIGYGGMLLEGALAILVIIAVAAGIGLGHHDSDGNFISGIPAWTNHYESWDAAKGLGSKIDAFITGSSNMIAYTGLPRSIALIVMGVFVASFAGTSLDTSTRLQRYFISELFAPKKGKTNIFQNRYFSTFLVIATALLLAFNTGADGKGALKLWPLFGTINQVLATLALLVISIYLKKKGGLKWLITAIPSVLLAVASLWACILNHQNFMAQQNYLLLIVNIVLILLALGIIVEGIIKLRSC